MHRINELAILLVIGFLANSCSIWEYEDPKPTLKIGVMLPWTGEYASDWDKALDWAVENINLNGGVAGHDIVLVKKDLAVNDLETISKEFIADESVKAVIGPLTSADVFEVAPLFINGKKILMAPVATSSNLSRAFAGKDYFWRLTEPDIAQTKTLLLLAQSGGARKVALITEDSQYGDSFEEWFGFFATELGLEVSGVEVIQPEDVDACEASWEAIVSTSPDAVIAALNQPALNATLGRAYRLESRQIRLLFSDAACLPSLVDNLGVLAENLEGTALTSDPSAGFDISYKVKYGEYPNAFLANMYDAVMLLALALEVSEGEGGESLVDALKQVVSGRDGSCSWQRDEIGKALEWLRQGIFPDINGASGSLNFDELYFTDVTSSTYGRWRVDAGQFVVTDFYTSDGEGRISSTSAAYRTIAIERQQFNETGTWPVLSAKQNNFAVLMATSKGWNNYRHQADVLHAYQLLKQNGFSDEQIILIIEDDLGNSPNNALPGVVRNESDGGNLYVDVHVDYRLSEINSEALKNILIGNETEQTPIVLNSSSTDNVFLFTSGHGHPDGMVLEGDTVEILTSDYWETVFDAMNESDKYRLIFWTLEACYSGSVAENILTPGVLVMTGANAFETSKAYFYDSEIKSWLADKFAYSINKNISENPEITFNQLYEKCFIFVNGSHVSFYNYNNFGNIYDIRLSEFVIP
ncbi:C13 family peptidase [Thermophagus sp. OGC60D27]|uniref:C13 family peptidase n=1 Tax=Thermophagus sp. OGC60D27 TaxID=3458415 RepID=UPI004037CC6B